MLILNLKVLIALAVSVNSLVELEYIVTVLFTVRQEYQAGSNEKSLVKAASLRITILSWPWCNPGFNV